MPPENRKRRQPKRTGPSTAGWSEEAKRAHAHRQKLRTPIAQMTLSVRVINALEDNDVIYAEDLLGQTYESLLAMKNFGEKTLDECRAALTEIGLAPPEWARPPRPKKHPQPKGRGKSLFGGFW